MLTVKEINEVSFGKAGFSGYKPDDVDQFIDEVAESFQQLEAERDDALQRAKELSSRNAELTAKNAELQEKLSVLAKEVETCRANEDGIKEALLSAQKLAKNNVQESKDKAEVILQDAQESARQMLDKARTDAAQAAQEYSAQTEAKRGELEEMKRQVTAFRASLLEMYKKHLEQINHIPNFRVKEEKTEAKPEAPEEREDPAPAPDPQPQPAPAPAPEPQPAPAPKVDPAPAPEPRPAPPQQEAPSLHDRVDFSRDQESGADAYEENDLSEVGIDLKTYSNIPESLQREKNNRFSNLEFGDDVDLGNRRRKK